MLRLFVVLTLLLALPRAAAADDGGVAPADEVRAFDEQIAAALSTRSCAVACEALGSMVRSADRLCALEPGPRCDDARARVRDAQHRVQQACPECAVTGGSISPPVDPAKAAAPPPEPASSAPAEEMVVSKRGGCAGCAVGGDGVPNVILLAALGVLAALARRRR